MKLHYSILAVLACYGCVSQQPKDVPSSPQDNSAKVDSSQLDSSNQTKSKITEASAPQANLKSSAKKQVSKTTPIKSTNDALEESVKSDSGHLSSINQTKPKITQVIVPQANLKSSTKKQVIKTTPIKSTNDALDKSVKSDSGQLSSTNQTKTKITVAGAPQADLKINTEKQEIKTTSIKSTNIALEKSVESHSGQLSSTNQAESEVTQIDVPQTSLETDIDNIDFDPEKLPVSFGGTWFLDRNHDSISKTTRCLLSSQKKKFNDGQTDTTISLQLSTDSLLIKTDSAIDLTYPDIGIYIDHNAPFPLETLLGDSSILIKQNTQKITTQLLDGEKLTIKLGFWPTWPQTETSSIDFALSDFDAAYQSFQACEKL